VNRRALSILLAVACLGASTIAARPDGVDPQDLRVARLHYGGGGDWYCNPSSLPNLLREFRARTGLPTAATEAVVTLDSEDLYRYPLLYASGHGRIALTSEELDDLRRYLDAGGFLWADDNYGMDRSLRAALAKAFPDKPLVELPFEHPIYHSFYGFDEGLPKIHEHDGGPPHGYGLFHEGRLVAFYSFNTDIGDGMEDVEVHNDPPQKHDEALKMGVNVVVYALTN
jgi:hypothetical protein